MTTRRRSDSDATTITNNSHIPSMSEVSSLQPGAPVSSPVNGFSQPIDAQALEDVLQVQTSLAGIRIGLPTMVPATTPAPSQYQASNVGDVASPEGAFPRSLLRGLVASDMTSTQEENGKQTPISLLFSNSFTYV